MELIKIILFFISLNALEGFENSKKNYTHQTITSRAIRLRWRTINSFILVKTKNRTTNCEPIFQKIWSKEFILLAKVEPENTKYLDYHCDPGERYFYKLEFIDVKGEKYIANNIMPPFANCLDAETELHNIRNFNALEDIVFSHITKKIKWDTIECRTVSLYRSIR